MPAIESWETLERIQALSSTTISQTLKKFFIKSADDLNISLKNLSVMDLGCGAGFFPDLALKNTQGIAKYKGVDIDQKGLDRLLERGMNSKQIRCIKADAKSILYDTDVLICLSNTFLSLGSWNSLDKIVQKLSDSPKRMIILLSIVPWDTIRKKWHESFSNWSDSLCNKEVLKMRSSQIETKLMVRQKMEISYIDKIYTFKHDFLKTNFDAFENYVTKRGLFVTDWINPHSFESINKDTFSLPEAWILLRNFQ